MSLNAKVELLFGKLQILIYCKYFQNRLRYAKKHKETLKKGDKQKFVA